MTLMLHQKNMEWISVKDCLPEEGKSVLIYGKATCDGPCDTRPMVREGRCSLRDEGDFEFGEYDCPCDVTYWMPLPESPKPDSPTQG